MFKHFNSNLLCTVTATLTGPRHIENDIVDICICPVNHDFTVSADFPIFYGILEPRRDGVLDTGYCPRNKYEELMKYAQNPYDVSDQLVRWFDKIKLREGKKIMPLAYNWPVLSKFLLDWLGELDFEYVFDHQYRDLLSMATFLNDRKVWNFQLAAYPKTKLSYLASQCKVQYKKHDPVTQEGLAIMQIYKQMLSNN
jgi:hypothetical protein